MAETLSCHQHRFDWLESACPRVVQVEWFNPTWKSLTPIFLSWASKERIGAGLNWACTTSTRDNIPALTVPKFLLLHFQTASFLRSATSLGTLCLKISWPDNPRAAFPSLQSLTHCYFLQRHWTFSQGNVALISAGTHSRGTAFPFSPLHIMIHKDTYPCLSSNRPISTTFFHSL